MPVIIHKMNASPPARTVLVTADILGLDIETREVNIPSREHFKPEYLAKNPLHTVPLLEDGDFILADSHAIIIYLVSKYGKGNAEELYPSDLQARSIVHQRLFLDASTLFPSLRAVIRAIAYDNAPSVDETQAAEVKEAYGFLEKYLELNTYVAGEKFTIADIACVTTVSSLDLVVPIEGYPKLQGWLNKLKSQDWYVTKNQPGLNDLNDFLQFRLQKNSQYNQTVACAHNKLVSFTKYSQHKAHDMPIILHKMNASPPERTVLIAEILGLEIETKEVNILAKEQFTLEYTVITP